MEKAQRGNRDSLLFLKTAKFSVPSGVGFCPYIKFQEEMEK